MSSAADAVAHSPRWEPAPSQTSAWLERGLALASRSHLLTYVALPTPIASAPPIVDRFGDQPVATWTSNELTLVGIGIAREIRGSGDKRWDQVIGRAHELVPAGDAPCVVIAGEPAPIDALGFARPRLIGGGAFAPGAADRAPWTGFGDAWFALPRWSYVHDGKRAFIVLAIDAHDADDRARWHRELAQIHEGMIGSPSMPRSQPALVERERADHATWRAQVTSITDAIARGTCSKIVAARTCGVTLAGQINAATLLETLDREHADCVRVAIRPPGGATLIAATPERLIRRDGDVVLCDALAGSISRARAAGSAELLESAKDRREHDLVVQGIRAVLESRGAVVDAPATPVVRTLRHVLHLHTPFRAVLRERQHVLSIAAQLHPTPAVGGTPTDVATAWIRAHEPSPRGWYAAPVGWFDLEGNGELAVALRCAVISGHRAQLWAGAGIVAGSDPDHELAETEMKLRAILGPLGVSA
ncbi:MAG: isochorismate synthase MenF [Kofleriaceae bacterium]